MTAQVCMGATLACTFGLGPSTLTVTPENRLTASTLPAATIMDFVPMKNIAPFPLCSSPANPAVIAATAAKLGVFTPAACLPVTTQPWTPGSLTILIGGQPALNQSSTLLCQWGGVISVSGPGQVTVTVP
ncbi:MAG: DUF4280 domain-containing protein [Caldilinea sp. CFX5]|nr:DUF4280 domain-containing protein [Caldilinea sp. CFX5]